MASITQINGKWRALIRRKGHKSICKTFATKAEAERFSRQIEAKIDQGKPVSLGITSVSDLIQAYRDLRAKVRPILDTSNEHYMLKHLRDGLGDVDARKLSPDDLLTYCTQRKDEGAGPYTLNMEISKLGTVLRYAGSAKGLELPETIKHARPLLTHMGLIGGGGKRERRPTEDEIDSIYNHLKNGRGLVFAEAVLFAIATAMRRGEVCSVTWSDVDRDKKLILIRDRKDPRKKAGNDQWIPLLPSAWELIERQPKVDDRIFPIHPQTLSKYFTEACRDLAIPDLHFHDLRHEGTSRLFEEGYDIPQVALVTGHKKWDNLKRYTNLKPEDLHKD